MDSWSWLGWGLPLILLIGIVTGLVATLLWPRIRARSRWIGSPMSYAVQLIGRLPDGRVETAIQGVPIEVQLPMTEIMGLLKRTLKDIFDKMPDTEETEKFGQKILPFLEAKEPLKIKPWAIEDALVVQFNHVEGTLDQYAVGQAVDPFTSSRHGGQMPLLVVNGALYPCPTSLELPGGAMRQAIGKIPLLSKGAMEEVEVFFFDPVQFGGDKIQMVNLREEERSALFLLVEHAANFLSVPVLLHEAERLKDNLRGFEKRAEGDKETIKRQGTELRKYRGIAGGVRPPDPASYLLSMTLIYLLWTILGAVGGTLFPYALNLGNNAAICQAFLIVFVILGAAMGFVVNLVRVGQKE